MVINKIEKSYIYLFKPFDTLLVISLINHIFLKKPLNQNLKPLECGLQAKKVSHLKWKIE